MFANFSALWSWFEWDVASWSTGPFYGWNKETCKPEEANCKEGIDVGQHIIYTNICKLV